MNIVVKRLGVLGDSLVTFPILIELREKYTNAHITFIGYPPVLPLAKAWGIADEVLDYGDQMEKLESELYSPRGIRDRKLRELFQDTDLFIDFGWVTDEDGRVRQNLLKAGVKEFINTSLQVHALLKKSMHIVEAMAITVGVPPIKPECIVLPNTGAEEFCSYRPPIAIHPGSSTMGLALRWPTASFAALIDRLLQLRYPVLLLIGPAEPELVKNIRQRLTTPPQAGMFEVLKNAPVPELARRLKQCGCFVGHDTGPSHLAGLLGIPTLALFGLSDPVIFRPLGPTVKIIDQVRLSRLPLEQVLEAIVGMYNSHR